MANGSLISPRLSLTLHLPPSCVQFCRAHPQFFVVGTYNLEKDDDEQAAGEQKRTQSRNGSLVIFEVIGDELKLVQTVSQPSAILDIRFHPKAGHEDLLAVVSSTGTLAMFRLDPKDNSSSPLQHIATSRCDDLGEDILYLQCNWHPRVPDLIAVTTSNSLVRLLSLDLDWRIKHFRDLDGIQNSLEAWCVALAPESAALAETGLNVSIYCGGDDSMLRYTSSSWDGSVTLTDELDSTEEVTETETEEVDSPFGSVTVKGRHDAGVTAILPLPIFIHDKGRLVLTGSYDEYLRVFALPDLHHPSGARRIELLDSVHLEGGVWRLDHIDTTELSAGATRIRILASCMHAGARVVEVATRDGREWACKVLGRVEAHESMNYGSDCMPAQEGSGRLRCVSTSFYDKLLCLWDYEKQTRDGFGVEGG